MTDPPALKNSHLASIWHWMLKVFGMWFSCTSGVFPMQDSMDGEMDVWVLIDLSYWIMVGVVVGVVVVVVVGGGGGVTDDGLLDDVILLVVGCLLCFL